MCKNRIFSPPIIFLLAVFFCLIAVRVEQAAQQGPQPDKSANKESNPQSPGPQTSGDVAPARWPIFLPRKSQPSGPQSPGGVAQEQKQEQKQESKTTPTPTAPEKQSPIQQVRSQLGGQGNQDDQIRIPTELVSLPVTVTDAYNRLVTGL